VVRVVVGMVRSPLLQAISTFASIAALASWMTWAGGHIAGLPAAMEACAALGQATQECGLDGLQTAQACCVQAYHRAILVPFAEEFDPTTGQAIGSFGAGALGGLGRVLFNWGRYNHAINAVTTARRASVGAVVASILQLMLFLPLQWLSPILQTLQAPFPLLAFAVFGFFGEQAYGLMLAVFVKIHSLATQTAEP